MTTSQALTASSSFREPNMSVSSDAHPFPKSNTIALPHNPALERPTGIAPAAIPKECYRPQWINTGSKVDRIVELISRFINCDTPDDQFEAVGRHRLTLTVARYVETGETMELVFPGFPFKSTSRKKVLGTLPDLAEEILLRRLDMLAQTISDYHPAGAMIHIVSDGVVYQDILQQSDSIAYRYSAELRRMMREFNLTRTKFVSCMELLDPDSGISEENMTEEEYVSLLPDARARFLAHEVPGYDVEEELKADIGTLATYLGYVKFLEAELEGQASIMIDPDTGKALSKMGQKKARKRISKVMLVSGAKFSDIVTMRYPNAIRISCHAHGNAGPKYAFDMLPGAARAASPWHNAMMLKADGSFIVNHYRSFDPSTYEVAYRFGRPYYLRELSPESDFGEKINSQITFTPNVPFGLIVKADPEAGLSFSDLPMDKIRTLSSRHSVLLLQGFSAVNETDFVKQSEKMGEVVSCNSSGPVAKLEENVYSEKKKVLSTMPGSYVSKPGQEDVLSTISFTAVLQLLFTSLYQMLNMFTGDMPSEKLGAESQEEEELPSAGEATTMHYDGTFITNTEGGEITNPAFQIVQCVRASDSEDAGKMMITNAAAVLQHGITSEQRDWLAQHQSVTSTPHFQSFGGNAVKKPLVVQNENTGHDVLRWVENWPKHVTKFSPSESKIEGVSALVSSEIGDRLTDLLYDRRFCYAHSWSTGDILIADNLETMHSRTAFKPQSRELWRTLVN